MLTENEIKQDREQTVPVGHGAWLSAGLALVHPEAGWMAVADVHYGYEICQRAEGGLFPLWGMAEVEKRLEALLLRHRPQRLIVVGDFLHAGASAGPGEAWLKRLEGLVERLILVEGNHDARRRCGREWHPVWEEPGWRFLHGHRIEPDLEGVITVQGHWHPAWCWRDGAGTRLKLPALVQRGARWTLPAFSPWAAGKVWKEEPGDHLYACGPGRVLRVA